MERKKEIVQDREACLERWIRDYSGAILQTCAYLIPDPKQAEDAVQTILIKAWRYLGNNKNKRVTNERAWLLRIANNTCREYKQEGWQSGMNRKNSAEELPPKMFRIQPKDGSLRCLLFELPEKQRKVVLLYYFQGLNQQEISVLLNVSISTVNRRLRDAQENLRKVMENG